MFHCQVAPLEGGATPVAANRLVLRHLPDELLERFGRLGILCVRNYRAGLGLSWREAFQTDSRAEVEAFCAEHRIAHAWIGDEHLRTWQRRAAFQRHPYTGERLWFNHGMFFHATSLEPGLRDARCAASPRKTCRTRPTTAMAARSRRRPWRPSAAP